MVVNILTRGVTAMRWASSLTIMGLICVGPAYAQDTAAKPQPDCHKTLFGGSSCASVQTSGPAATANQAAANKCRFGTTAAGRLLCANPKLASMDLKLSRVIREAKQGLTPEKRKALEDDQRAWIRDRNGKCGLQGKDSAPLDQLRRSEKCVEDEISQRIALLQNRAQADSTKPDPCQSAKGASARLICSDPHLAEINLALSKAYHDVEEAASPADRRRIAQDYLAWEERRDKECGLTGLDAAPTDQVRPATLCLERKISAQVSAVLANSQINSAPSSIAQPAQDIAVTPILASNTSSGSQGPGSKTFQALTFSGSAEAIRGVITCSAPATNKYIGALVGAVPDGSWITAIRIEDDANSYRIFKEDRWAPVVNRIRTAARSACAAAVAAGTLRNTANESIKNLDGRFAVYAAQGLFAAYSAGENAPWTAQINLFKTAEELKARLQIDSWVDPGQLTNNPYFYKDKVIGAVLQFEQMFSQNDAIFTREGRDIFVANTPPKLFNSGELIVLAGRVEGNKGVIKSSGDETLMPALEYVGMAQCGDNCEALEKLPTSGPPNLLTTQAGK
jgi:uncharacterized protein